MKTKLYLAARIRIHVSRLLIFNLRKNNNFCFIFYILAIEQKPSRQNSVNSQDAKMVGNAFSKKKISADFASKMLCGIKPQSLFIVQMFFIFIF